MFLNHSCDPNSKVNSSNETIISLREINKGEIITFNYKENESIITTPFICKCNYCLENGFCQNIN